MCVCVRAIQTPIFMLNETFTTHTKASHFNDTSSHTHDKCTQIFVAMASTKKQMRVFHRNIHQKSIQWCDFYVLFKSDEHNVTNIRSFWCFHCLLCVQTNRIRLTNDGFYPNQRHFVYSIEKCPDGSNFLHNDWFANQFGSLYMRTQQSLVFATQDISSLAQRKKKTENHTRFTVDSINNRMDFQSILSHFQRFIVITELHMAAI